MQKEKREIFVIKRNVIFRYNSDTDELVSIGDKGESQDNRIGFAVHDIQRKVGFIAARKIFKSLRQNIKSIEDLSTIDDVCLPTLSVIDVSSLFVFRIQIPIMFCRSSEIDDLWVYSACSPSDYYSYLEGQDIVMRRLALAEKVIKEGINGKEYDFHGAFDSKNKIDKIVSKGVTKDVVLEKRALKKDKIKKLKSA